MNQQQRAMSANSASKKEAYKAIDSIFIVSPEIETVLGKMQRCYESFGVREPDSLFIDGPPGVGKSALHSFFTDEHRENGNEGTIVTINLPYPATPDAVLYRLLTQVSDPCPERGGVTARIQRFKQRCERLDVRLLVMDEFAHFVDSQSHTVLRNAAEWLKSFMIELCIPIVGLGAIENTWLPDASVSIDARAVIHISRQLSDRFPVRHSLHAFSLDGDMEIFLGFLAAVDHELPLPCSSGLDQGDFPYRLWFASSGRMRPLMRVIRGGAKLAIDRDHRRVELDDLSCAFQDVHKTDALVKLKINPFECSAFDEEDLAAAEANFLTTVQGQKEQAVQRAPDQPRRRSRANFIKTAA